MACARSMRDGPPPSVNRMLRDTSTRIGRRLLLAADGGTSTTGRNRMAMSSRSVAALRPIRSVRDAASSGTGTRT